MNKFPFACLLLLAPSPFAAETGSIRFLSVDGDPLIAGRNQNLSFCFAHYGQAYSTFEFVFEIRKSEKVIYQKKATYFKAPDGQEELAFRIPGRFLEKNAILAFEARLEHTYSSAWGQGYACYQKRTIRQTPKEAGGLFMPQDEELAYSFQGLYYPHLGSESSRYVFRGVGRDGGIGGSKLNISEISLYTYNVPENAISLKNIGELRIYTDPERWNIGERKKKFVAVPVSFRKSGAVYSLALSKGYSFSKTDGTMNEGDGELRDLLFPSWSIGTRLHFAICLNSFSLGEETFLFYRDVVPNYESLSIDGAFQIHWEEL